MWKLTVDQKSSVVSRYSDGESSEVLGLEYGVSAVAIRGIVRRRGGKMRSYSDAARTGTRDDFSFHAITDDSAYWSGFMMADGCVYKNAIAIVLSIKDVGHVEKFKKFVKSSNKLIHIDNSKYGSFSGTASVRFEVRSRQMADDLAEFGIVPNKTMIARVCDALKYNTHFWRGVVDGDGWIGVNHKRGDARLDLVGSFELMNQFCDFIRFSCPSYRGMVRPHKGIFRVGLCGIFASYVIRLLYDSAHTGLDRKMNAARNILAAGIGRGQLNAVGYDKRAAGNIDMAPVRGSGI
jgi:hypothetical protein